MTAGASVLFLPGMMCDERLFAPQMRTLERSRSVACARLAAHDSMESMAVASLEARGADPRAPVVLVGLSMGGIVAMECLRAFPERVAALVLMDTNPLAEVPERQRLRDAQIERALGGGLERLLIDEMKPLYLAPTNRDDESLLGLVLAMARGLGPDVFVRQARALQGRRDYRDTLRSCTKPVLILHGEHDTLCPPERHALMHALVPQSTLVTIPDAGHLPTLEAPAAVEQALTRFLASL